MGSRLPALILLFVWACSSTTPSATSTPTPSAEKCRAGAPEAGVWQPDRLEVLNPCQEATGLVVQVIKEPDGDHHIWFTPDAAFESLLNKENHFQGKPTMLAEITPDCDTNPPDANTAAKCPASKLEIPGPGDRIDIYGPWVHDLDHGWNEIHPVDSITISDAG